MEKIKNCKSKTSRAYSLVEIAIVLFIISLITVASFSGIALKKRAIINTVITDLDMLAKAYKQFVSIYTLIPGDVPQNMVTQIFGSTTTGYGKNYTIQYGNGDGMINNYLYDSSEEPYIALQHLSIAGLIKGEYDGYWYTSAALPQSYMPGPVINSGYAFGSTSSTVGGYSPFSKNQVPPYTQLITFSAMQLAGNNISAGTIGPVFTSNDMELIDVKFDDGVPNTGKIYAANAQQPKVGGTTTYTCIVTTTTPYSYATTSTTGLTCYMAYLVDQHQ